MTKLEELVREVAMFKTTRGGRVRLIDDRGDLLVEWPKGCPNAPITRNEAVEKALALMREAGFDA